MAGYSPENRRVKAMLIDYPFSVALPDRNYRMDIDVHLPE
jgi:hypothetical protein